ncbi:MAG: hypothetical protein KDA85_22080, partial [Planctomycetaceae bacterium]|nr:hypothetical protein [Planctomycetaceae bacterium]
MTPPPQGFFRCSRYGGSLLMTLLLAAFVGGSIRLGTVSPVDVPDTPGYTEFDWSMPALLAQRRTFGYPLYLRIHELVTGGYAWVCWGQAALFAVAAVVFSRAASRSRTQQLAILTGMLGANIYWLYNQTIATDTPAAAMGILSMAFVLQLARQWRLRTMLFVCIAVTAAWCIRPAMLAVLPAAVVTYWLVARQWESELKNAQNETVRTPKRKVIREAGWLCVGLCVPVLLFCSLRLAAVGKFGIVSFGGYNLIGVVGQFPNADEVSLTT